MVGISALRLEGQGWKQLISPVKSCKNPGSLPLGLNIRSSQILRSLSYQTQTQQFHGPSIKIFLQLRLHKLSWYPREILTIFLQFEDSFSIQCPLFLLSTNDVEKITRCKSFGTQMSEFLPEVKGDYGISCISWLHPYPLFPAFYALTKLLQG